jgi:integrase
MPCVTPASSKPARHSRLSFPELILPALEDHLERFSGSGRGGLVFCALKGQPLRRSVFNKSVKWHELVAEIGVPNLHLHDLRHTGNTLAASSGASLASRTS